mmetsp:Transcript_28410/g.42878  ORF Transcript_28410/g.42878 Transcript_28410/m.42878 type:complete len:102 (+) Transcript_28410:121-426(+)
MIGGALRNKIGGYIVNLSSYIWGFISLGAIVPWPWAWEALQSSCSWPVSSTSKIMDIVAVWRDRDLTMKRRTAEVKKDEEVEKVEMRRRYGWRVTSNPIQV